MNCKIYKCSKKSDVYLFVREQDELSDIPDELMRSLGNLTFVMDLRLDSDTSLANSQPDDVIQSIEDQGFYLQIPPANDYLKLP